LNDPRLGTVTITEVEVTADLKLARVFFSARGDQAREKAALQGLEGAAGFIKKNLGRELRLRYMPDLMFQVDRSFDYGSKIDRLIRTIQDEKERDPQGDR
jgi:ribosome-binding factor A